MQRSRSCRRPPAEDGAVLVIVVLSLLAMFGMMILVVDVGSLLYARRALVNAADAAALAAAQSCGQKEGTGEAVVQARFYTVANESGADLVSGYPTFFPSCSAPAGLVTVRVTTDRPLFFAPVLGADTEAAVTTEATASWGGAGVGEKVAPLMLSANRLSDCQIPPATPTSNTGLRCAFYWNNSSSGHTEPDLANAEWGTLDLLKWDITTALNCDNSTPPQFEEWMLRGFGLPLPIDSNFYGATEGDDHTYVCRGQGHFGEALDHDIEAAIALGDPIYFPVNRPTTQVDSNGNVCSPDLFATTNCSVDKYDIIGFARLFIREIWGGGDERDEVVEHCGHFAGIEPDPNARCMIAEWMGYTPEGLDGGGGENFGLVPVRLVK
ncbi:MAG: uncharacterized protein K0R20_77 [Actinomycetia bacterium]|nr:uncharacterized protein [Actinomycetes bacterium]